AGRCDVVGCREAVASTIFLAIARRRRDAAIPRNAIRRALRIIRERANGGRHVATRLIRRQARGESLKRRCAAGTQIREPPLTLRLAVRTELTPQLGLFRAISGTDGIQAAP